MEPGQTPNCRSGRHTRASVSLSSGLQMGQVLQKQSEIRPVIAYRCVQAGWHVHIDCMSEMPVKADLISVGRRYAMAGIFGALSELGDQSGRTAIGIDGEAIGRRRLSGP